MLGAADGDLRDVYSHEAQHQEDVQADGEGQAPPGQPVVEAVGPTGVAAQLTGGPTTCQPKIYYYLSKITVRMTNNLG
jgi:hypothetical protein